MAIQEWTIINLVGPAAQDAAARFAQWWQARRSSDATLFTDNDWPPSVRRAVAGYLAQLERHRCELPVAYFNQHVDHWLATGQIQFHLLGERMRVWHDAGQLWCYRLPDRGRLVRRNRSTLRHAQFPEVEWLARRLIEAAHAHEALWRDATLLINRRSLNVSPSHDDRRARAAVLPKWIAHSRSN